MCLSCLVLSDLILSSSCHVSSRLVLSCLLALSCGCPASWLSCLAVALSCSCLVVVVLHRLVIVLSCCCLVSSFLVMSYQTSSCLFFFVSSPSSCFVMYVTSYLVSSRLVSFVFSCLLFVTTGLPRLLCTQLQFSRKSVVTMELKIIMHSSFTS